MLKSLKNKKAQAVIGEYLLVFLMVVGMITAITLYFRRAVQARIRDANYSVAASVATRANGYFIGDVLLEYEPYYIHRQAVITRDATQRDGLLPAGAAGLSGIYIRNAIDSIGVKAFSNMLPPRESQ